MILHVFKHPSPDSIATCNEVPDNTPVPEGYEPMSPQEYQAWIDAEIANGWAPPAPEPMPPEIPWAISNADLRRQLVLRGINPALVLGYLNGLEEGAAKWAAVADWEYANYFERSHPMLNQLAPSFGLSVQDVDDMFLACPAYPRL